MPEIPEIGRSSRVPPVSPVVSIQGEGPRTPQGRDMGKKPSSAKPPAEPPESGIPGLGENLDVTG